MPLFSSRPRTSEVDGILQIISMGECDDQTIKRLQKLIDGMSDDDIRGLADSLMTNLVKYPDDIAVLTGSVRALEALPFMPKTKNEFIITLLLSLLKAPVNKKDALQRKTLKSEIVKYLVFFVVEDDSYARLMMPELISAMDDTHGAISSSVFHTLQRLATEKPEYFEHYSAALIKQLGSINRATRAESAKVIGLIARSHPEYVSNAMPFLQSLASFYPDAHVKRNANEAYQVIWQSKKREAQAQVAVGKAGENGKGFADIVKLNSSMPDSGMSEAQFTDDELKEIIELTRKEFKNDAEAILDSLGVGHLAVKSKEGRKKASPSRAAAIPEAIPQAKPKKEEKVLDVAQFGTEAAKPRPKAATIELIPVPQAEPKREEKAHDIPHDIPQPAIESPAIESPIIPETKEPEVTKPQPKAATIELIPVPQAKPMTEEKTLEPKKEEKTLEVPQPAIESPIIPETKEPEVTKPQPKAMSPEPVPRAKPKREDKAVITPRPVTTTAIRREAKKPEAAKPRPKVVNPEPQARPKKEEKTLAHPQPGVVESIMWDITEPEIQNKPVRAKADPKAGRVFKCPKCGKHVWEEGQLCNSCAAEEFDSKSIKGHYDIST